MAALEKFSKDWQEKSHGLPRDQIGLVKMRLRLNRNGEIVDVHLANAFGYTRAEMLALKAALDSSAFGPMPSGAPDFIDVDITVRKHDPGN